MHFLFQKTSDDLRNSLFNKITEKFISFTNFTYCEKGLFLFKNNDSYIRRLAAAFIFQAMELRKIVKHP